METQQTAKGDKREKGGCLIKVSTGGRGRPGIRQLFPLKSTFDDCTHGSPGGQATFNSVSIRGKNYSRSVASVPNLAFLLSFTTASQW